MVGTIEIKCKHKGKDRIYYYSLELYDGICDDLYTLFHTNGYIFTQLCT